MATSTVRLADDIIEPLALLDTLQRLAQSVGYDGRVELNADYLSIILLNVIRKIEQIQRDLNAL